MNRKKHERNRTEAWGSVLLLAAVIVLSWAVPAAAWVLDLPTSVDLTGPEITLGELISSSVPQDAASLVLVADGKPGKTYTLSRSKILRQLTTRHLAKDVVLRGAKTCRVTLVGRTVDSSEMKTALLAELRPWLPLSVPGGPETTVDVLGELPHVATDGRWSVALIEQRRLRPGRNLVALRVETGGTTTRFTAAIDCIAYDEVPYAIRNLSADESLNDHLFNWEWQSLTSVDHGVVVGRAAIRDMVLSRGMRAGDALRVVDIQRTPLVRRGEMVELVLGRGGVEVTMRGVARQDGAAGQTIPVKNETTGRLVSAKVVGPGRVAWRN